MAISREEAERLAKDAAEFYRQQMAMRASDLERPAVSAAASAFFSEGPIGSAACFQNALAELDRFSASVNRYDRMLTDGGSNYGGEATPLHPPLLINGEQGTGKTLFVGRLRNTIEDTPRRSNFYEYECSELASGGLQEDLGRHLKGEGQSGAGQRGIIFLDEIGDLEPKVQAQISAAVVRGIRLEESGGNPNLIFVATTNRKLAARAAEENFNRNLLRQFSPFMVRVPPLREMRQDIPLLIQFFLHKYAYKLYREQLDVQKNLSLDALETMLNYEWPGNGMELALEVQRLVVQLVCGAPAANVIEFQMLSNDIREKRPSGVAIESRVGARTTRALQGPFKFDMATNRIVDANGVISPPLPARFAGVVRAFFEKDELVKAARRSFLSYEAIARDYLKGQVVESSRFMLPGEIEKRVKEKTPHRIAQDFARDFRRYLKTHGISAELIKCESKAAGYWIGKDWDSQKPALHRAEVRLVSGDDLDARPG